MSVDKPVRPASEVADLALEESRLSSKHNRAWLISLLEARDAEVRAAALEEVVADCEKRRAMGLEVATDHGRAIAEEMRWTIKRVRALATRSTEEPAPEEKV